MIRYIQGDLFAAVDKDTDKTAIIPHVCNDIGAWGAGFVLPLGRKYPKACTEYHRWYKTKSDLGIPFALGQVQFVQVQESPEVIVCNMIGQHQIGGTRPLRYTALAMCMDMVGRFFAANRDVTKLSIHCPMFGSGLSGGHWPFIEELIKDAWIDRGYEVNVHYIPGQTPAGWKPPKE